ncbi:bifunctional folylpolyglutamate synthase/dihydrofolate synthase [Sphingobium phenoxybenzoativorans]|uniref:bifunctional folylpolyglutamate synthase/dihydrofolate synthase n=1 Tax=Sphingobium phenoxybenzoativorans TaxID=1592790 RepID=UPI00087314A2|nr:folylpolyglutamate synthase/dihydrofolate synthase family protein [Sphingobium phenoxybenzoativorans]
MPDHAVSSDPAVQAQLDRLAMLSPGADILGLERITSLLDRLGDPHLALPPVFHVAGTNGKGSTCAFLRAALEADGKSVHVFTSPHLVRFNERIRINGGLISDELLAAYLERVLDVAEGIGASFFEVTTAAMFLAFAEHRADACIVEVGLGGRLDATNVIPSPAACGIAQLGIDHQSFLGDTLAEIAGEKAGIAKAGTPVVTMRYPAAIASIVERAVGERGGLWRPMGSDWDAAVYRQRLHYRDSEGRIDLPLPRLSGPHQPMNAALATAMLRHQQVVPVSESALKAAPLWAHWPARLQRLEDGPLLAPLGPESIVWLDGGHNASAGEVLGQYFDDERLNGRKLHLVAGMLANKDIEAFLAPLEGKVAHIHGLPVEGHAHHPPARFAGIAGKWGVPFTAHDEVTAAIGAIGAQNRSAAILIAGSLYLAGDVLKANRQLPD